LLFQFYLRFPENLSSLRGVLDIGASPRPHRSLKDRYPRTPAMAAGVADHIWSLEEIAALLD
jgi:hypothetical protein